MTSRKRHNLFLNNGGMTLPSDVQKMFRKASNAPPRKQFQSIVYGGNDPWDRFIEMWAPRIHSFVEQALGPYGTEPLPLIIPMSEGMHSAGATASFDMVSGQVTLCASTYGQPGQILEKLTHEFTHGSLSRFPEGDPFTEEGYVDYTVWLFSHAPLWGEYQEQMISAAEFNIEHRRERAFRDQSDYERKRWAGGVFAMFAKGPYIVGSYRLKKAEGNYTWLFLR